MGKSEDDESTEAKRKLEDFARLQLELDRSTGSITGSQLFVVLVTSVILVFFTGAIGEIILGAPFGIIGASVVTSLAIVGMTNGIRASNLRRFVEVLKESDEEPVDDGSDHE